MNIHSFTIENEKKLLSFIVAGRRREGEKEKALQVNRSANDTLRMFYQEARCDAGKIWEKAMFEYNNFPFFFFFLMA